MRTPILLLILAATSFAAPAQPKGYDGQIGGTVGMSIPTGEFADTWGKEMFTFGGQLAIPSRRLPLQLGLAFGYGIMGKDVSTVTVSDPSLLATEGQLTVKAKVLSYHPFLRFSPSKGRVRPYVDGLVGMRQFTTQSRVTVEGLDKPLSKERNANDFVMSSGWAAGLMIGVGEIGYIEARVERFHSGKTTYVDPSSITTDSDGNVTFNTLNSATGAVNVLLGLGIRF